MSVDALYSEINSFVSRANTISADRKYWLLRTQGGYYYESFRDYNYVAINYDEIKYSQIASIIKQSKDRLDSIYKTKELITRHYKEEQRPGFIANQILKFVEDIKKGDIVLIPSFNSHEVTFGTIRATPLIEVTQKELATTKCPYQKRKAVSWIKRELRTGLDPYLYRVLQAHQAINDIGGYAEIIERTLGNFFIKDGVGNLVLDVQTDEHITAIGLFTLGYNLLQYSNDFFEKNGLTSLDINKVDVKINLNSKGKIQLKSPEANTIWIIALIVVGLAGGGLKFDHPNFKFDLSTDGIIKKIIEYQNNQHDREISKKIIENLDSLKVKSPEDAIKLTKQFSTNKDLPK